MKDNFNLEAFHQLNRDSTTTYLDNINDYLAHSKIFAKLSFILIFICLLASVVYYDLNFFAETIYLEYTKLGLSYYIFSVIQITTALSCITISLRRFYLHKYRELSRLGGKLFIFSIDFKYLMIELIILCCFPMDAFRQITFDSFNEPKNMNTIYNLNDIMFLLSGLKVYILVELFLRNSIFSSFKMQKYLKLSNIEDSMLFIMKCLINNSPYTFFTLSFLLSIGLFSYLIRVCEMPLAILLDTVTFQSYFNAIWMVVITMTTVGYSDIVPATVPGRIITFFMIIWGIYLMSLIIIILFQSLQLNRHERLSLTIFNKLELKKKMYKHAALAISECWLYYRGKSTSKNTYINQLIEFTYYSKEIRILESSQSENFYQKMNFYYDNMSNNVQELSHIHQKVGRFKNNMKKFSDKKKHSSLASSN